MYIRFPTHIYGLDCYLEGFGNIKEQQIVFTFVRDWLNHKTEYHLIKKSDGIYTIEEKNVYQKPLRIKYDAPYYTKTYTTNTIIGYKGILIEQPIYKTVTHYYLDESKIPNLINRAIHDLSILINPNEPYYSPNEENHDYKFL